MKFKGLVAAIAATLIAGPLLAAGSAQAAPAPAAPKIEKEQLAKGMKEGPAVLATAGVACTPDQFYYVGEGKDASKKSFKAYEVSCKEGLGYFLNTDGTTATAFDCLSLQSTAQKCILPGNLAPEKGLGVRAQAAGRTCDVAKATASGRTADGELFFELACSNGTGFEMGIKGDKTDINECAMLAGTPRACKLTGQDKILASFAPAVAASGKTCALKDERYIGTAQDNSGDVFFEVACQTGPGFVVVVDKALAFRRAIDCRQAEGIGGGCKMTDTTQIETQDNALYSRMAAKAGYNCQVSKYRFVGVDKDKREAVELQCSDRPDGAFAFLTDNPAVKPDVYDCVRIAATGQSCKLNTDMAPLFAKYQKDLASKGKTCNVTGVAFLAATQEGDFVELACSEPPGWTIAYPRGSNTPTQVLSCPQIKGRGIKCKLPSNASQ